MSLLTKETLGSTAPGPGGALRVVPIKSDADLHKYASAWDCLADGVPFRTWAWNECWWRHFRGARDRLYVLGLEDREGRLRGLAPWYISHSRLLGRVLRFLGTGNVCSEHLTILSEPAWRSTVVSTLVDWLTEQDRHRWDTLEFDGVDSDNEAVHALVAALAERMHPIDVQHSISAWRINLPTTWEEYLDQLSGKHRKMLRRIFRNSLDTGEAELHVANDPKSLAVGWQVLESLHSLRRESLGQSGCFASSRFTDFHREMIQRLLASRQLRLQWLELNGCPAAAEYGLCDEQTVYCYQTGFDPQFAAEKPGWLSFGVSIRRAISQGYRWFDFLRGDEPYKSTWHAEPRSLSAIRVFADHWRGSVHYGSWSLGQKLKPLFPTLAGAVLRSTFERSC